MNEKNGNMNPHEIAVIGYSQAGKTTLAVGLYATSTPEFTVTAKGEESENYLLTRKAMLDAGEWASANKDNTDIRLSLNRRGKTPITIDFRDYRGEDARNSEAFKRDVVGDPRGALILMNPSMDILRDPERRNEMIAQIKGIIDYLSEPDKRCSHIAFVITASDLLMTSLKDYKDEFDGYKAEITNCLNVNQKFQKAWKEFDVTVTGPLEDPSRPRIARKGNTSREPFEWLIGQFEAEDRGGRVKKACRNLVAALVTTLVLGGLAFAGWCFGLDRSAERKIGGVVAANGKKLDKAIQDGKAADINKCCKEMEATLEFVSTNNSFWLHKPFFEGNKERYHSARTKLSDRIECGRLAWLFKRMSERERELTGGINSETGLSRNDFDEKSKSLDTFGKEELESRVRRGEAGARAPEWKNVQKQWETVKAQAIQKLELGLCANFSYQLRQAKEDGDHRLLEKNEMINANDESWFKDLKNLTEDVHQVSLVSDATNALAKISAEISQVRENLRGQVDAHNEAVLRGKLDAHEKSAAEDATEEKCTEWRREIEQWMPVADTGRDAQTKLLADFDKEKPQWRSQHEGKKFADESEKLKGDLGVALNELDDADKIYVLLEDCKHYETLAQNRDVLPFVSFDVRTNTWAEIQMARAQLLQKLVGEKVRQVNPRDRKTRPNESSEKDKAFECVEVLKNRQLISEEEYGVWTNSVIVEVGELDADWVKWQNEECEEFVKRISAREGSDMALDSLNGKNGYQDFCSNNPCAPGLNAVANAVNDVVMKAFRELWCKTKSYVGDKSAIENPRVMKEREKKMQETYNDLKDLVNATVKAGMNNRCKEFRASDAYRFAAACQDKGNVKKGNVTEGFQQRYVVSRIDAKISYKDFQFYFDHVSFTGGKTVFNVMSNSFEGIPMGGAWVELHKDANNEFRMVWKGKPFEVAGTPWKDAVFFMTATDVNTLLGAKNQTKEWRFDLRDGVNQMTGLPYFEVAREFDTGRLTGDSKPVVSFRIYVQPSGIDFLSFAKPYLFGDN